jgi:hypothetical protein
MDPYLEGSEWTSMHFGLCSELTRMLAPKVRPRYIVRPTRRFVTDLPDEPTGRSIYPDVGVLEAGRINLIRDTSVAVAPQPIQLVTIVAERVPQISIEIRDVAEHELVTVIEVLSPANKRGQGYRDYLKKRQRLLVSTTHLVEIDLLRHGAHVPMLDPLPRAPYFVFLSRAQRRPVVDTWAIQLPMRLPIVPVPLLEGNADVDVDLQAAFATVYDDLGYDLSVDYGKEPEIPLSSAEAAWVQAWLSQRASP